MQCIETMLMSRSFTKQWKEHYNQKAKQNQQAFDKQNKRIEKQVNQQDKQSMWNTKLTTYFLHPDLGYIV